ncbi:MAG: ribonuclease HII [Pelovirga sp.]
MKTLSLFESPPASLWEFEAQARQRGFQSVAGIDEAGRGPLAGPVVAAAVMLPVQCRLPGLTDSKKLSAGKRQTLYPEIRRQARGVGVGVASVLEIDRLNILQATLLAMQRAVDRLPHHPDYLLIDGISALPRSLSQQCIKQGDSRSLSIAAASVIAKVIRDRIMLSFDQQLPGYGFARHKGYGTRQHRLAIAELGPSRLHRKTFAGVREYLA